MWRTWMSSLPSACCLQGSSRPQCCNFAGRVLAHVNSVEDAYIDPKRAIQDEDVQNRPKSLRLQTLYEAIHVDHLHILVLVRFLHIHDVQRGLALRRGRGLWRRSARRSAGRRAASRRSTGHSGGRRLQGRRLLCWGWGRCWCWRGRRGRREAGRDALRELVDIHEYRMATDVCGDGWRDDGLR